MALVRHCVEEGGIIPSRHFREKLQTERLTYADAVCVLESGAIYDPPECDIRTGQWKYRIEGYERTGVWLAVVFTFTDEDEALLVTVFTIQERSR
jgi:hypothetical protein